MASRQRGRGMMKRVGKSLALIVLTVCVAAPLVTLLVTSLSRAWFFPQVWPAAVDGSGWRALVSDPAQWTALRNSVVLATATGVLATMLALPLGRAAARSSPLVRRAVAVLAFITVALPPVALGIGLQLTALTIGLGGTLAGVLLAHLVPALGYLTIVFLGVFIAWDTRLEDAAATLGANRNLRWRLVVLPLLRRPIAESMALGFLVSWAQVALTLLVGGGAVRTLPLDVLALLQAGQDQRAAVGALALAIPALAVMAAARVASRHTAAVVA
jgi:putative spermidine/putrescine transport system permease protein